MNQESPVAEADSSIAFAEHFARTRYEDLPKDAVTGAKYCILDTIACLLAGTAGGDMVHLREIAEHDGGRPESTVIGAGGLKLPAASAVLVNAAAIHQDDFDDTSEYGPSHPTSASLPPALALAEAIGGKSGKDLILAVALGNDLTCRLSRAIKGRIFEHPWFRPPVVGLFGGTAAAASILGATANQHLQALGLTLPMIGGTWASLHEPNSSVRSIRDGLAYRNAVLAARLAMKGLRGDPNVFDGRWGFFHTYYNGNYDRDYVVADLGTLYETARVSLKPWPANRLLHKMITATLDVMEGNDLSFEDIANVEMEVGVTNLTRCYIPEKGWIPHRRIDLLSNLPFNIAATIRYRGYSLPLYHDAALVDDVIETALPKVSWIQTERQNTDYIEVGRAKITTTSGKVFNADCDVALGHPNNPMSDAQRHQKFYDCTKIATNPVFKDRANQMIDVLETLEKVDDLEDLLKLLR